MNDHDFEKLENANLKLSFLTKTIKTTVLNKQLKTRVSIMQMLMQML